MKTKTVSNKKDIAIVGMAGKFPKSESIQQFWSNLMQGNELIHFYSDEELEKSGVAPSLLADPNFVKARSFIDHPGTFDYAFFGYTRDEASLMDPQIRLMHEQVWRALEDSGIDPETHREKIGLYLAAAENLNWKAHALFVQNDKVNPFFRSQITSSKFISTLIAYNLNLQGPGYFVDTACSSSLVAVHMACRNLLMKECSVAIAGGVCIDTKRTKGYHHVNGMIFSKDGHCKAFDADSSGTISGDGAGVVVLKRLEDALNSRDHIYAVIRASAVNNDGRNKIGYTAPSVDGQASCIRLAHQIANVKPDTITYVETHGTGTKLGDPIEIEALNKAFEYNSDHSCAIGSVKSNIGHLDTAAGVAGLIKATLAINKQQLPPSLHFKQANPAINFKSGPFYVNVEAREWQPPKASMPLRAGLSSFGIGGTNVHMILEEAPAKQETTASRPYQLLLLSAKTKAALQRNLQAMLSFAQSEKPPGFADLGYTLKTGRQQFRYRHAFVADNYQSLCEKIESQIETKTSPVLAQGQQELVFMFPGQGSQYYQMAIDIYEEEPQFREVMDEGFRILKQITGEDFKAVLGYDTAATESSLVNETRYTQPLVFLLEYALARLLMTWGLKPDFCIGHSLGEYVAACLGGVFTFEEALHIIVKRAQLMDKAPKGAMVSIAATVEDIKPFLTPDLSIAVINTEQSLVVSGNHAAIQDLISTLVENKISHVVLKTSHAFHSPMMEEVLEAYKEVLAGIEFQPPKTAFISNLSGKQILPEEATDPNYWVRHLRETVNFSSGLNYLLQQKQALFIEVGPGKALSSIFSHKNGKNQAMNAVHLLRHPKEQLNDNEVLTRSLGRIWSHGGPIDWQAYYALEKRNKVSAFSYAFKKTNLPALVDPFRKFEPVNGNGTSIAHYQDYAQEEPLFLEEAEEAYTSKERPPMSVPFVAPTSETEKKLCEIWCSFLDMDQIGVEDDFFELGGDSLKALSLLQVISKSFETEVLIQDFYGKANIKAVAAEIDLARRIIKLQDTTSNKNTLKI